MTTTSTRRSGFAVVAICFATILADGYDLVLYGATLTKIKATPGWEVSNQMAGLIGSLTLFGLMIGFMVAGPLSDRFGRRKVLITGVTWFSLASMVCALSVSPEMLGATRFITGIGLGAVVPSAVAMTVEYAPLKRRQLYTGLMITGYSVGGIIAALAAMAALQDLGWRFLFGIAGAFVLIVPVMYFRLPESAVYLYSRGRIDQARMLAHRYGVILDEADTSTDPGRTTQACETGGYRKLLSKRYIAAITLFTIVCFLGNVAVYGLGTWLPEIMHESGYDLGSSISFLLTLQIGAITGMLTGSSWADRFGPGRVILLYLAVGAVSLMVMSQKLPYGWLMVAVIGAGIGTTAAMMLTYGFIAAYFPSNCRASAVGMAMGIGRTGSILGPMLAAMIMGSTLGHAWSFYVFAIALGLAAASVAVLNARPRRSGHVEEQLVVA
ncbi:MFS transporter [Rhodococcus jostii]|uniref:MFS transporter n=1 Tax=Rhodococcus jostii TaxID=132919 RepID=UPI003663FABD